MSHEATFTLPLPPSINVAYADVIKYRKDGRPYPKRIGTEALNTYKGLVRPLLYEQGVLHPAWEHAKELGYDAILYLRREIADWDAYVKAFQDSTLVALGVVDKQGKPRDYIVTKVSFEKRIDAQVPRIEVHLFTLDKQG